MGAWLEKGKLKGRWRMRRRRKLMRQPKNGTEERDLREHQRDKGREEMS